MPRATRSRLFATTPLNPTQPSTAEVTPPPSMSVGELNGLLNRLQIGGQATPPAETSATRRSARRQAQPERSGSVREHLSRGNARLESGHIRAASLPPPSRATARPYDRSSRTSAASRLGRGERKSKTSVAIEESKIPNPPWLATPAPNQPSIDGLSSALSCLSIVKRTSTPERISSRDVVPAQTWRLPSADAAEEASEDPYDMSLLQDALDACGQPETPRRRSTGARRSTASELSASPYAPAVPPVFGKIKTAKRCKVAKLPYSREDNRRKKNGVVNKNQAVRLGYEPGVPDYLIMAAYGKKWKPTYEPPIDDPDFPYEYSRHTALGF